jgi:hypothetical protein
MFYLFFVYIIVCNLSSSLLSTSLGEVGAHVALKIEVSKLVTSLNLEESRELRIRIDLATVVLVLEVVGLDVLVDITGNLGAGHLGADGLVEKLGELLGNTSGLHETRRSAVTRFALTLRALLLGGLELTSPLLLKDLVLSLEGVNKGAKLVKLGKKLNRLLNNRNLSITGRLNMGLGSGCSANRSRSRGSLNSLGRGLLGLYSLLDNRGNINRGSSRDSLGFGSSGFLSHLSYYTIL